MTPQTHSPEQDGIIRKIQKLLSLATSQNEAEATLAMARAQELLAKHNLDFAMVKETAVAGGTVAAPEEKREKTRINRSAKYRWQRELWAALAQANFCWYWTVDVWEGKRGTKSTTSKVTVKRHMILGKESNVVTVRMMGEYLEDTIERILPYANTERMSRSALSWKTGCAERLAERIAEKTEAMKTASEKSKASSSTAIALRDVHQSEYEANYDAAMGRKGAYQQKLISDEAWEKRRAEREKELEEQRIQAEKDWLVYLQTETPQQKKQRERQEERERIRDAKRHARSSRSYWRERDRESAKVDHEAYRAGKNAGAGINIGGQVHEGGRKDRSLN